MTTEMNIENTNPCIDKNLSENLKIVSSKSTTDTIIKLRYNMRDHRDTYNLLLITYSIDNV